jgi:NTP pyrophosphatase (non-canonical NTP hydrolase)
MDDFQKLFAINKYLSAQFGNDDPFQIVTRLAEETGEIAEQINHFEGIGVKKDKHGEPDKYDLASEVRDVIIVALQVAMRYGVEDELKKSIDNFYKKTKA